MNRIAKHVYSSYDILEKSTYYILDAQGNTISVYEREMDNLQQNVTFAQSERHIYGSSRLGVLNKVVPMLASQNQTYSQANWTHTIGERTYEISNHLGNVLSVISDKPIPHISGSAVDYYMADIRSSQDYSPFGVTLEGRNFNLSGSEDYRYGFNGMEADDEIKGERNSYDFGARMYDSRVGRWYVRDPLEVKYASYSPYSFVNNMPIIAIDPDGERIIIVNGYYNTRSIAKPLGASESCKAYWGNNFEGAAQEYFHDYSGSTQWVDGNTLGQGASGKENFDAGYNYAKANFKDLTKGMSEDEVINFVGHSMGAAFASGMATFIQEEGTYKVENIVLLSAHQADQYAVPDGANSIQLGYLNDPVVSEFSRAGNVDKFAVVDRSDLGIQYKHGTTKSSSVFNELQDLKDITFSKTNLTHTTYEMEGPSTVVTTKFTQYKLLGNSNGTNFNLIRNSVGEIYKPTNAFKNPSSNFYRPYAEPISTETNECTGD